MYDVIWSGAGCIAAKVLVDAGYAVLLAEKLPIPREKSCMGILIEKSVGLIDTSFGKIPRSVLSIPHQIKGMMVTTEAGKWFTFECMGINVWRSLFDYWLTLETIDVGVEFREWPEVSGYREEEDRIVVTLRDGVVSEGSTRILIDCDGAAGIVRRILRRRQADYLTTYQTCAKGSPIAANLFNPMAEGVSTALMSRYACADASYAWVGSAVVSAVSVISASVVRVLFIHTNTETKISYPQIITSSF